MFHIFDPKLVLEDILDLIVSWLSPVVFIDHCTMAVYKSNLDIPCIKHMYLKFKYVYVIQLCHTSADFSMPQLFTRVPTPHSVKKHTILRIMAKTQGDRARPKEYKMVLCNSCPFFCGNEDSAYNHICHLHLCMAVGVAGALTGALSVSHVLTSGITSRIVLQRDLIAAWLLT